jgi:hypothetical protein
MRHRVVTGVILILTAAVSNAGALLTYNNIYSENGFPANGEILGWQFTANQPITITNLGLYDDDSNGFVFSYQVGLFRVTDGALLTSGAISAGTSDPLINRFRYVDVVDATLTAGQDYVVAFQSTHTQEFVDAMIESWDVRTVDPAITLGYGRFQANGSFSMPENVDARGVYFVGPNAMFTTIPIPAALWLLGSALGVLGVMRRRAAA